eukprot:SAG31_NODE_5396_length_2564_cov_1.180122_2_plen_87_part_00
MEDGRQHPPVQAVPERRPDGHEQLDGRGGREAAGGRRREDPDIHDVRTWWKRTAADEVWAPGPEEPDPWRRRRERWRRELGVFVNL